MRLRRALGTGRDAVPTLSGVRVAAAAHRSHRASAVPESLRSLRGRVACRAAGRVAGPRLLAWIGVLAGRCQHLLAHETRLWTFLRAPDIPLINNAAERALRGAVLWRKASFGVWSHRGEQFRSHILSAVETCRMRGLSVIAVVQRIVAAVFARKPYPDVFGIGLLPSSQSG